MTKKTIIQQIEELASDDTKRSKTARLREIIDTLEASIAAGVNRAAIVEKLAENGLEMTVATFNSELRRIRKKRGKPASNLSKADSKNTVSKFTAESPKNEGQGQAEPDDEIDEIDELAGLSAREKRERRIAQFTTDYKPTNPLYEMLINGKFG